MRVLIVPGLNGSGPEHWQTLWEVKYGAERVCQRDWANPDVAEWTKTLDDVITARPEKTVIVAHSLGSLTVALWTRSYPQNTGLVQCAVLVAPPDVVSTPGLPESMRLFAPQEPLLLPFPSILVGSENDPYMSPAGAGNLAHLFGSRFINAGFVGHINTESGHGPWPEGEKLLWELIDEFDSEISPHGP